MADSDEQRVGELILFTKEKLGKGSYGIVYKGRYNSEVVAVKKIWTEYCTVEEEIFAMELSHENVVRYFNKQTTSDFIYIAMALCEQTLRDYVRGLERRMPDCVSATEMLLQAAVGLEYLHSKNIVHRDLKPRNVLISGTDSQGKTRVKLADFGLSKLLKCEGSSFSRSTSFIGSVGWTAPELADYDKIVKYSYSADVFSLGCIFGYALTGGSHPFGDDKLSRQSKIVNGQLDWKDEHLVNSGMQSIVKKMISREPKDRPSAISIVVQDLNVSLREQNRSRKLQDMCRTLDPAKKQELVDEIDRSIAEKLDLNVIDATGASLLMQLFIGEEHLLSHAGLDEKVQKKKDGLRKECAKKLLSEAPSSLVDVKQKTADWGYNALHLLVKNYRGDGIEDIADLMIKRGVDVKEKSKGDWSPLLLAIRRFNDEQNENEEKWMSVATFFLKRGADPSDLRIVDLANRKKEFEARKTFEEKLRQICDLLERLRDNGELTMDESHKLMESAQELGHSLRKLRFTGHTIYRDSIGDLVLESNDKICKQRVIGKGERLLLRRRLFDAFEKLVRDGYNADMKDGDIVISKEGGSSFQLGSEVPNYVADFHVDLRRQQSEPGSGACAKVLRSSFNENGELHLEATDCKATQDVIYGLRCRVCKDTDAGKVTYVGQTKHNSNNSNSLHNRVCADRKTHVKKRISSESGMNQPFIEHVWQHLEEGESAGDLFGRAVDVVLFPTGDMDTNEMFRRWELFWQWMMQVRKEHGGYSQR